MSLLQEFYVYQYVTEDMIPYYIGKGKKNRIHKQHTYTILPPKEQRIIIKQGLSEIEALILENDLIRKYGRKIDGGILDNIKINRWACNSGWNHSEETKARISNTKIGVKKSIETKERMRVAQLHQSEETRNKIRLANLGRKDDGRNAKIRETMKLKRWYNNGYQTGMYVPGQEPSGYILGRKIKAQ
jgi:hypothetical protein